MRQQEIDIAVVGAGPAGLMAAAVAARAGASVLVLEEQAWAGGRLALQTQPLQGPRSIYRDFSGVEFCRRLLDEAVDAGAQAQLNTRVVDLSPLSATPHGFGLTCISLHASEERLEARAVVLAAGSREPAMDFPGATLPGVMLSGDAQVMLNVHGRRPGRRALMVGSDNAGLLIAANLLGAGIEVAAVVEESPRVVGREFNAAPLRDAGVEILTSSRMVEAEGKGRVESATIESLADKTRRSFEVDAICLAGPRAPEAKLAALAGCPLREQEVMGGSVPIHDRRMATPIAGLYVCGDAAGVENGAVSLESGRLAGLWAARGLGSLHPDAQAQERLARARLGYLRRGRRGGLRRQAKAALESAHRQLERKMREIGQG